MGSFSKNEIVNLREVLQKSIGEYSNQFTDEDINELGITLLQTTAIVLKARCKQETEKMGRLTS